MTLESLQPIEAWAALEKDLFAMFGFQGSVFNAQGERLNPPKVWSNRLCPQIKSSQKGQSFICAAAQMNMTNKAREAGEPVIDKCDAGLAKFVVPIFFKGEFLGVAGGCGCLTQGEEVETFAVHKLIEISEEKVSGLAVDVPRIDREKTASACGYIKERIEQLMGGGKALK